MRKFLSKSIITSFLIISSSCSNNGPEVPELDNAEAGVATGAVIGAGLGALVGSTAGEAGAGVVLGSIAGATSGGVIGSSFDNQERRIDAHDKKAGINTKKTSAKKNNSSSETASSNSFVDKIWMTSGSSSRRADSRNFDSDNSEYPSNRSSKSSRSSLGNKVSSSDIDLSDEREVESPQVSRSRITQLRDNSRSRLEDAPVSKPRVELTPPTTTAVSRKSMGSSEFPAAAKKEPPKNQPEKIQQAKVDAPKIELQKPKAELPPAKSVALAAVAPAALAPAAAQAPAQLNAEIPPAAKKETVKNENPSEIAKSKAPVENKSNKCELGKKEADRAMSSTSDSDKVFYLRRALQACPSETSLRVELGKVYRRLGLKEDARKEFNTALESDPANGSAEEELSIMMLEGK